MYWKQKKKQMMFSFFNTNFLVYRKIYLIFVKENKK